MKNLEQSKQLLYTSSDIAHFEECHKQFVQLQGDRVKAQHDFKVQQENERNDRMFTVLDWLSPVNQSNRHDDIGQHRAAFPKSTDWLFNNNSWKDWNGTDHVKSGIFWVTGIPGAGKLIMLIAAWLSCLMLKL